ncbi:MAG: DotA/TraY family protein [Alphaproteobacteria bacterium]
MNNKAAITKSAVIRYMTLPGIRPRFEALFGHGFKFIPFFIAQIFLSVRLLPATHPYLQQKNLGLFGVRHVIAEAANNLNFDRKNIDQVFVFGLILLAMVIVIIQILLVFWALFLQTSYAGPDFPNNFSQFFIPGGYPGTGSGAPQDLALILLDMVFGVPEMFRSCVDQVANPGVFCESTTGTPVVMADEIADLLSNPGPTPTSFTHWAEWPYPIHVGLHQLFAVYSYGLLIIAVFITSYFVFTIFAETAQTGTAFGKRFNKVWAPIRIVVAFGLLVPIAFGMNSGQFIVLYAAKFGSGFGSNGWAYFNLNLTNHYTEAMGENVSVPNMPEFGALAQFFLTAATCKAAYLANNSNWTEDPGSEHHIAAYLVRDVNESPNHLPVATSLTGPGMHSVGNIVGDTTYDTIMSGPNGFGYKSNRLILRFGIRNPELYGNYLGNVKPLCGEVIMNLQDSRPPGEAEPGPEIIQRYYWFLLKALWANEGRMDLADSSPMSQYHIFFARTYITHYRDAPGPMPNQPHQAFRDRTQAFIHNQFRNAMLRTGLPDRGSHSSGAIEAQRELSRWGIPTELTEKGWAGAAIWFNRIAEMNGAVTSAAYNIPLPSRYPHIMEQVKRRVIQANQNVSAADWFKPELLQSTQLILDNVDEIEKARAMYAAYAVWGDAAGGTSTQTEPTGNIILDTINSILGTHGLFDMRRNANVNPLAQITGLGRGLVEASIRNIGYAAIGSAAGGLIKSIEQLKGLAQGAGAVSSFMITIAMVTITAGFILYYIVPFLPFIYFFFAVGGWVKGIFEAMVGVPLWALAHIRIDGEGLSGQAALNGYFLIFEIFLRPILIVFGFIASILIFSALVLTLNDIFDLIVANVAGADYRQEGLEGGIPAPSTGATGIESSTGIQYIEFYRGPIDELFFTLIYVMLVYMIGQSCFKLIDQIPNNIMRWMGQNIETFNDMRQDPAEGLVGTAQMGTQQFTSQIGGGLQQVSRYLSG